VGVGKGVVVAGKGVTVGVAVAAGTGVGLDGRGETVNVGFTGWLERTGLELGLAARQAPKPAARQQHRSRKFFFFNTLDSLCQDRVYQKIWRSPKRSKISGGNPNAPQFWVIHWYNWRNAYGKVCLFLEAELGAAYA
jgi:hypothetical protein